MNRPDGMPSAPGCYIFRNVESHVIYVGKAKTIKNRLGSYFQSRDGLAPKTQFLMDEAHSVEWIITPSELDALILENELIKQYQPRYNLRLKDDKSFPYVAIDSRTAFPVPYITRGKHQKGVRYFGPYVDVRALRVTIDELLHIFPLRSCSRHKYEYQKKINRPCLLFDIGKCSGPCIGAIDESGYQGLVESWARFFSGDVSALRDSLTSTMTESSSKKHYEAAAKARDGLEALDRAAQTQSVVLDTHSNIDTLAVSTDGGRATVVRFKVRNGRVVGRSVHFLDRSLDETTTEILEAVITEMYPEQSEVPAVVSVQKGTNTALVREYLSSMAKSPVDVVIPMRGKRRRVMEMALNDALSVIARDTLRRQSDHNVRSRALQEIGAKLQLAQPPFRMECFDMSHLQGTNYVGSMVVFEDGVPMKSDYRHFNVKEILGNDDFGAMQEVVRRRLEHWREDQHSSKFRRADLIVIDGGLGQLHAAEKAAEELGLLGEVEFVAMAKREEFLYRPGSSDPIVLDGGSEGLYLMQRLRDEAHRFAINFHRSKRGKSMVASTLEGVEGLGPSRRDRLIETFGSLDGLRAASREELEGLPWLPKDVARRLYDRVSGPSAPRLSKETEEDG
jgi:excinuclease ABC subunit C